MILLITFVKTLEKAKRLLNLTETASKESGPYVKYKNTEYMIYQIDDGDLRR